MRTVHYSDFGGKTHTMTAKEVAELDALERNFYATHTPAEIAKLDQHFADQEASMKRNREDERGKYGKDWGKWETRVV